MVIGIVCKCSYGPCSGCCQREKHGQERSFSAGNANSALTVTDGLLTLVYTDGKKCHHVAANRSTVITFICVTTAGDTEPASSFGRPHFVNEEDCTYKFTWPTPLACQHTVCAILTRHTHSFVLFCIYVVLLYVKNLSKMS